MGASHRLGAAVGGALAAFLIGGAVQFPAHAADYGTRTSSFSVAQAGADNSSDGGSLTVATWNMGHGTIANARRVLSQSPVLALQEAGDQSRLVRALQRSGYQVIVGSGRPGQSSTPLIFDPNVLRLVRPVTALMVPSQRVGPGTGPETMKAKWLIGGRFVERATGTRVFIGTTHLVAGQSRQRRARVATRHVRQLVSELRRHSGIRLVMGDFNTRPSSKVLAPLRAAGWTSDQIVGKRVATHGSAWAPDQVWWNASDGLQLVEHHTIATRSDHDALVTTVTLPSK